MKVTVTTLLRYEYECEIPNGATDWKLVDAADAADPITKDLEELEKNKNISIVEYSIDGIWCEEKNEWLL